MTACYANKQSCDIPGNAYFHYRFLDICDYAAGDAVVLIDADLQDPPELIPELVKHWREG
jgi:glycosyltransferase involved in cell wall biosynthesis